MRPEKKPDNFNEDIEIFDLPEEEALNAPGKRRYYSSLIENLWRRQRRTINNVLMMSTILLAFVLLYNTGGSVLLTKFTGTPSQGKTKIAPAQQIATLSSSEERVLMQLRETPPGPAPGNCPASPKVTQGKSFEQAPLRIFGFRGPNARLHLHVLKTFKSPQGPLSAWGTRIIIEIEDKDPPIVWLQLSSTSGNDTPIFGLEPGGAQQASVTASNGAEVGNVGLNASTLFLNTHMPTASNGETFAIGSNAWETNVYFSKAGCYTLTAGWPSGHWQINFASGI